MDLDIAGEQALLGAILRHPDGQERVLDAVEPEDMRRPWHGQVLAAMHRLQHRAQLPTPERVYDELQEDPYLPRSVSRDAVPLVNLMQAAPSGESAGTYAAIVIESSLRRQLQLIGQRVSQAAESGDLDEAVTPSRSACRDLDDCAARWNSLPERLGITPAHVHPTPMSNGAAPGTPARDPAEPGDTSAQPDPPGQGQAPGSAVVAVPTAGRESATALRDLIDNPAALAAVRLWLRPEHLVPSANGRLYAVLQDMDKAGVPIDPVTVSWSAARHGVRTDPAQLSGGAGPFAVASAREAYRTSVLARLGRTAAGIQAGAANRACSLSWLIPTATARLQTICNEPQLSRELDAIAEAADLRQPRRAARQAAPEAEP